ncbi:DISARM system SNF2-like helicase DrmD [Spirulina subsalsa FACHB-351]|uniref:DISARM system SNF2-like helicase DrmD n=1 Tax=Spirulina subsalsa FACHB-351 TaxID=234711 RepID=A0ABT3L473_9CYAN|nr:DISARM system SNF2-like helicase DrmD [Spirulina subsalsa]MCW6036291.1 DISARM system SNF2-like helicase DrmD [Spirulina subsalsa FACHB-351]
MSPLPEQGQLVEVRGQRYTVTAVHTSTLPTNLVQPKRLPTHHLISLASIEDDATGEQLEVVWEVESGARIFEERELPYPFALDDTQSFEAFLDAVRWGAVSKADRQGIQSPFRSGIDIEDYQLDPVVRAVQMPRVNLLIADDVGLGKTIEAGLVAQELVLRQRAHRMLIVCPSALQVQWREQMRDKFGLDFRIVNSDLMRDLRRRRGLHINPWSHYPRLITSIDFVKRDRPLQLLQESLPGEGESIFPRRIDLLIVDEAHNIAPPGGGRYAVDSLRTKVIRFLVRHCEHKLFLSATPHNGYRESFTALLELLDSQRFAREIVPEPKQLNLIMVRRLKRDLPKKWDGSPRFPERQLEAIAVPYTEEEREANRQLNEYTRLRRKGATDKLEQTATEFVLKLLKKRLFSSPQAFLATLFKHEESFSKQRRQKSLTVPTVGLLQRKLEDIDEEFADDDLYEESTLEALDTSSALFRPLTPRERELLNGLKQWAQKTARNLDSKAAQLLAWLDTYIRPGGQWSQERVIIFTEYRATQKWLADLLLSRGMGEENRLMVLYGGMVSDEREKVKAAFQAHPDVSPVRILLATDAASEGLDLQNYCSRLIHYEIPWNPNRMEQRNGRIDRHGQRAEAVKIYHFVGQGYQQGVTQGLKPGELEGDLEFLMRAAQKINTIREDLGKVGPVIAAQVEEAMLGQRAVLDTTQAESEAGPMRRLLKFERKVNEEIAKLKDKLEQTRQELRLDPANIQSVVQVGLRLAKQPALIPTDEPHVFSVPALSGSWAVCQEGLRHPHTGDIRPLTFDPDRARGQDDVVLAHLNHRLVQMCLRLLRAEVWSRGETKRLNRVAVYQIPSRLSREPVVLAYGRLVILGGDQERLNEEVIVAGGKLSGGQFKRLGVLELNQLWQEAKAGDIPESLIESLRGLWERYAKPLQGSLEARMRDRQQSLQKQLEDRCQKEIEDITSILEQLRASIEKELEDGEKPRQLELFSRDEQSQYEQNRETLRRRLADIPGEIQRETQLIRDRYANPTPRLFPLAIAYLVPPSAY